MALALGISSGDNSNHLVIRDLLKDATAFARDKSYDAAIYSLLKAYKLMETCSTEWGTKEYFRIARYQHLAGRYDEALKWLQDLYDTVDSRADAREALYEQWGFRQKDGFAKISATLRNKQRQVILAEIQLLKTSQQKIIAKQSKS